MKKSLVLVAAALALLTSSCGGLKFSNTTATTVHVRTEVASANVADLEVGNRVTFRYTTTAQDRHSGLTVCKNAAVAALLKANGSADVLVSPEYNYDSDYNYIEVSGRPGKYTNFRGAN